jgi:hypothetical protein
MVLRHVQGLCVLKWPSWNETLLYAELDICKRTTVSEGRRSSQSVGVVPANLTRQLVAEHKHIVRHSRLIYVYQSSILCSFLDFLLLKCV